MLGYRAQEVRWADKVNVQDTDQGEEGFLQGGGLAAYQDTEGMPKVARTAKVQVGCAGRPTPTKCPRTSAS